MISFSISDFKKLLIEKFIFCFATFNFTIGLVNIYGKISILLGQNQNEPQLSKPITAAGIFILISVIILVILSKYSNMKFEKVIYKSRIENPEILYLICVPSIIISIILLSVTLLKDIFLYKSDNKSDNISDIIFDSVALVYYMALLLFLFQSNGVHDFGENWFISLQNLTTILFTIISQIYFMAFYVFFTNTQKYLHLHDDKLIKNSCENLTNESNNTKTFCNLWKKQEDYIIISIIISGFSCIVFLLKPFLKHYEHLQRLKFEAEKPSERDYNECNNGKIYMESFVFSITIGVVLFTISLIFYKNPENNTIVILFYGIDSIIYLLMLVASGLLINMIKDWPHQNHEKREVFNQILVWTGLFGQISQTLAMIAYILLQEQDKDYNKYIVGKCIIQIIQNIVQSILESVLLEKQMKLPKIENNFLIITSIIFLTILNLVLGTITVFTSYTFVLKLTIKFPNDLFSTLLLRTGLIFSISQRFHGAFLFFKYIRYIAKRIR